MTSPPSPPSPPAASFRTPVPVFLGCLLALVAGSVDADDIGSGPGASRAADTSVAVRAVEFIAHPILEIATWPLENVLAPGVEFLTYPTQPPIRYFLEENVIDRATGLFQFGAQQDLSI